MQLSEPVELAVVDRILQHLMNSGSGDRTARRSIGETRCDSLLGENLQREFTGCVPLEQLHDDRRLNPIHGKPQASVDFIESVRSGLPSLHTPVTWLKASPGVVPSDDYPPSLKKLEELKSLLPRMVIKQFGPGHHFLAEENPDRVVELVVEAIKALPGRA